jgi:hypothetical protein
MSVMLTHIVRFVCWVELAAVLSVAAAAQKLPDSFEEAQARAEAQEHAVSTKSYFAGVLLPYYSQNYAAVLQSCFAKVPSPSSQSFAFVAAIGADGRVLRLYHDRETNIFRCMTDALEQDVFPTPPVIPYYLHIDMRFSDEAQPERPAQKQNAPPLVLEPNKYSYTVGVPQGWDFSFAQAQEFGARLVLFPKGGSFHESNSVIYINELCKSGCTGATQRSIERTIEDSKEDSPALQVATQSPIRLETGEEAPVRIFTGARDPRQAKEALAFIEHKDALILVVLTTQNTRNWVEDYAAFQQVVSGHRYFACDNPRLAVPCR